MTENAILLQERPQRDPKPPARVPALPPIASLSCSTYASLAVAVDGRCFSWGDRDGNALGLGGPDGGAAVDAPAPIEALRGSRVVAGSLSYTNGAVATRDGRVHVWGGNAWEGGIAENARPEGLAAAVAEVAWRGVPSCYACKAVALGHNHGYLLFEARV